MLTITIHQIGFNHNNIAVAPDVTINSDNFSINGQAKLIRKRQVYEDLFRDQVDIEI